MPRRRLYGSRAPMIGGAKRQTNWFFLSAATTAINGSAVLVASLNAAGLAKRPFTVVRTHLMVYLRNDQLGASELVIAGVGMAVVSEQSSAVGVTAVPTPLTEEAWDGWLYHRYFALFANSLTESEFLGSDGATLETEIDSKAMRKLQIDQAIFMAIEVAEVGTATMFWSANTRTLVKLA